MAGNGTPAGKSATDELLAAARRQRTAGDLDGAAATCERALSADPESAGAHALLGRIHRERDDGDAALANFRVALRLDRSDAKTWQHVAELLAEQGQFDDAVAADRSALVARPGFVSALCHLAALKRFEHSDDPDLRELERLAERPAELERWEWILLLFTLGRAYEELGEFDRAFASYQRANGLKREMLNYDVADELNFFDEIASVFTPELVRSRSGAESQLPVLIVGMPRSGTSLVEQILASHPNVHGGGERRDLYEISTVVSVLDEQRRPFPRGVTGLSDADLRRLGEGYAARLAALAPSAARVTDKAPMNFRYLGFAQLVLPRARIIHCVRDPIDTCASCYSLLFRWVNFSYDLVDLGRYYRGYAALMEHWKTVLPTGSILDIRYEDLVTDFELHARRLVAHCGLEWSDACLSFGTAEHKVRTASVAQVRRPIYTSSVERWRRYERHLGPLIATLDSDG